MKLSKNLPECIWFGCTACIWRHSGRHSKRHWLRRRSRRWGLET